MRLLPLLVLAAATRALQLRLAAVVRGGFDAAAENAFVEVLKVDDGDALRWQSDDGVSVKNNLDSNWSFDVREVNGSVPLWSHHALLTTRSQSEGNSRDQSRVLGHRDTILPDHTDKQTILNFGLMAFNAYYEPDSTEWLPIPGWAPKDGFGSTKSAIRGHIYKSTDPQIKVIVIVIKGTSLQTPFQGGKTGANDKLNDNKMFSCCCGKAGWSWRAVEGCACANSAATECKLQCVQEASDYKESYYRLATTIADAAMDMYPTFTAWTTGHSLGGSLASLVSLTFDLPAITFEPPGDFLFAKRIGLLPPAPPAFLSSKSNEFTMSKSTTASEENWDDFLETLEIYQFGNDGDPIYLGTCMSGIYSSCWLGGYAIETKCHLGKECVYTVGTDGKKPPGGGGSGGGGHKGTVLRIQNDQEMSENKDDSTVSILAKESINNHGIQFVLDSFLRKWEYVPECKVRRDCVDCGSWSWLP